MKKLVCLFLVLMLIACGALAESVTITGVGQGIDGDVVVQITADATTIYDVQVLEQNETVGIGSVAVEQLPGAIVEANSIAVDGIAGATVTSNAIKDAIRQALTEAGIDPTPFETAQEATAEAEKTAVTLDCDVVLGGSLSEYLLPYLPAIRRYVLAGNPFAENADFVQFSRLRHHITPLGAALYFIRDFVESV